MAKRKILSKGYTLEVDSWENDGDNYKTKRFEVDSREEAIFIKELCTKLFISSNPGISNRIVAPAEKDAKILEFARNYAYVEVFNDLELLDYVSEIAHNTVENTECGCCIRVCSGCIILYSDKDIFVDTV
jgi:hypothetical protein